MKSSDIRSARTASHWALACALGLALACASGPKSRYDEFAPDATMAEESSPLGGEALVQKKVEMQRGLRDLMHMHRTVASLSARRDRTGFTNFAGFLEAYLGTHIDPMLRGEWQSRHPELMALDANLRLMKAEVYIVMRDTSRVQETIDDILARYTGRENMLVQFPGGEQGTLLEGLQKLQQGKWRG